MEIRAPAPSCDDANDGYVTTIPQFRPSSPRIFPDDLPPPHFVVTSQSMFQSLIQSTHSEILLWKDLGEVLVSPVPRDSRFSD